MQEAWRHGTAGASFGGMKSRSWLGLTALLALVTPAAAAPDDPLAAFDKEVDALFVQGGLTSDQAASRAGTASPTVRRKAAEVDASIASAEAAELARVPQVGAKVVYTRLSPIDPLMFGTIAIPFLNNSYVAEANVNVNLSDYIVKYPKLVEAAKLAEEVAKVSRKSSEVDAGEDARLAYYEWVRARLQVLVSAHQLVQVRGTLKQVQALADAQRVSKADLMRVQSQEAEAEQVADQLQNLAALREEQLRILIGASADEKLGLGEDIRTVVTAGTAESLEAALGKAKQTRLDFKTLDVGIEAKDKQTQSEKANQYPRLSAFAVVDEARPNPRIFPQADEFKLTWQVGAQITWTLNDNLISKTTEKRLRAETNELRSDRESLERGARLQILAAQQAVALAQHALTTSAKGLAAAAEGYRVRQALLAAERATGVELVDAETDLTRARIAALNARVDLRVAMTQLAHALGTDVAKRP